MKIIRKISEAKSLSDVLHIKQVTVGFVPTMGALHEGHLALVKRCKEENDICIVSIFVNPIQFNNTADYTNYPRDAEQDALMLTSVGCDILFEPTAEEMYPVPETAEYHFDGLERQMEGEFRPGHFNGVAIVVKKLFEITTPDKAYFGEKDFQQLLIVERLVQQLNLPVKIVNCPIVREADGLAMSSRNRRLNVKERECASHVPRIMRHTLQMSSTCSPDQIREWVTDECNRIDGLKLDYFEIADNKALLPVNAWNARNTAIGFIAVFVGPVRLIDNIKYY
ncbi:MAG: pantoate--beta-alanine ligase [Bacteroidota bacterium]